MCVPIILNCIEVALFSCTLWPPSDIYNIIIQISMMEVYNESIYNLLVSSTDVHEKLTIQQRGKDITIVVCTRVCNDE